MDKGEDALFARSWQVRANATDGAGGAATRGAGIFSLHARAHIRTHDFTHTHTHRQKQRKKRKYIIIVLYLSGLSAFLHKGAKIGKESGKELQFFVRTNSFPILFQFLSTSSFTAASPSS
jgi:hypothetical protein